MSARSDEESKSVEELRAMAEREPLGSFMGIKILKLAPRYAKVSMKMKPEYVTFNGMVFGGIVASVADSAFGLAVNTVAHPSIATQFNIYFISRAEATDDLTAECQVIKSGKRLGISEITVTNQKGDLIAKATGIAILVGKKE